MRHARIIEEISRHQWAISHAALEAIQRIVTDGDQMEDRSIFHGSESTLEEREVGFIAEADGGDNPYRFGSKRGNVGILHVSGPIVPREAGEAPSQPRLTTSQGLMNDHAKMEADPEIDRIAAIYDTPGGAVTLTSELAAQFQNGKKPIVAYVEGHAGSAGYWSASSCDAVVAADTAMVGSVGVVAKVPLDSDGKFKSIVSTQSEFKNPDVTTEEGEAVYQSMVNDMGDIFVNAIAEKRSTTREDVLENFGKGGMVIASRAKAKGMIDAVMTRHDFIQQFSGDLEACSFLKKSKSSKRRRFAQANKVDFSGQHVELKGEHTALDTAVENPNQGDTNMDLKQFLEENAEARAEFAKAIATAEVEAKTALQTELKAVVQIATSDEYSEQVHAVALKVIAGEMPKATFDAALAMVEMNAEKVNSEEAQDETEEIGDTPAVVNTEASTDGKIRTQADLQAVLKEVK